MLTFSDYGWNCHDCTCRDRKSGDWLKGWVRNCSVSYSEFSPSHSNHFAHLRTMRSIYVDSEAFIDDCNFAATSSLRLLWLFWDTCSLFIFSGRILVHCLDHKSPPTGPCAMMLCSQSWEEICRMAGLAGESYVKEASRSASPWSQTMSQLTMDWNLWIMCQCKRFLHLS